MASTIPSLEPQNLRRVTVPLPPRKNDGIAARSTLSIDLVNHVLWKLPLHPFIAWVIVLCLRAKHIPWEFTSMRVCIAYAIATTILWMFFQISNRIAFGMARDVDLDEEVVVITGGASGLGMLIAEVYGLRGANVAVLDVKEVERAEAKGITSYKCDVGDREQVQKVARLIEKELGTPTILINNAGVVVGKSILDLSFEEIERTLRTNLLSHFNTIKTFLPGMLDEGRGTIVTISSVLGSLGAANLSDYSATKAGLTALHNSLKAELSQSSHPSAPWIRTVLVTPGQMATSMFASVKTPSSFFAPVVEPTDVAKEIIKTVDAGENGEIAVPLYARHIGWLNVLPLGVKRVVRALSGVDKAVINAGANTEWKGAE